MSMIPDALDERAHYVYRCYTATDELLYVGCAINVADRMWHHLHACNIGKQPNSSLRRHHARVEFDQYPNRAEAREAERQTIRDLGPLLNRQHNPKRFRKVRGGAYVFVGEVHPITAAAFPELGSEVAA